MKFQLHVRRCAKPFTSDLRWNRWPLGAIQVYVTCMAYVSISQHTSAYVSIRQHTSIQVYVTCKLGV